MSALHSRIGFGEVCHARQSPRRHAFRYPVFMPLLDLAETGEVFRGRWLWSVNRANVAAFHREDYFGDSATPLRDAVWERVEQELGPQRRGQVLLAANLRYWGYAFNPIAMYFLADAEGQPVALLADVTNTPWGDSRQYVVPLGGDGAASGHRSAKVLHVSPFMEMEQEYRWQVRMDDDELFVGITNFEAGRALFHASIRLDLQPADGARLARALLQHPFMTGRVIFSIYWQALLLRLKGLPYIPPPEPVTGPEQKESSS